MSKLPGESPSKLSSDTLSIELSRAQVKDGRIVYQNSQDQASSQDNQAQANQFSISTLNGGGFAIPSNQSLFKNMKNVDTKVSSLVRNPYLWNDGSGDAITGPVSSLSFSQEVNILWYNQFLQNNKEYSSLKSQLKILFNGHG